MQKYIRIKKWLILCSFESFTSDELITLIIKYLETF